MTGNRIVIFLVLTLTYLSGIAENYKLEFTDCYLEDCSGFENDSLVQFGYLTVPEDRGNPEGRKLKLSFVVIDSGSKDELPDPLIYMSGGPGGIAISSRAIRLFQSFPLNDKRDVILMDFRGTGYSEPQLSDTIQKRLLETIIGEFTPEQAKSATSEIFIYFFDEFIEQGYNPDMYNTKVNVEDMEDLRKALGYKVWNLFGISYGTRTGQTYVRDYPESVRSQILDSPIPMGVSLLGKETNSYKESLDNVFKACSEDPECSKAFPDLESRFYRVMESLKEDPFVFKSDIISQEKVHIDFKDMHVIMHQLLYSRGFYSTFPWMVKAIEERDQVFFENMTSPMIDRFMSLEQWVFLLTTKYDSGLFEYPTPPSPGDPLYGALNYFINTDHVVQQTDFVSLDSLEAQPVDTDIPTLILSGEFDPITRPSNAVQLKKNIPSAYLYTFPGTGHAVVTSTACGLEIANNFLKNPFSKPDDRCLESLMNNEEVDWVTDLYFNPNVASFFLPYFRDGQLIQFTSPALVAVVFLFSFFAGIIQMIRKKGPQTASTLWNRNFVIRVIAFVTVLFFGALIWLTLLTAEQGALIITGLIGSSKFIFWIPIVVIAGTLYSVFLYIKALKHSKWGGRIQFGILCLGLIGSCVLFFRYQFFPGFMI